MKLPPTIRNRLADLADYVETHGSGALRGESESQPFSLTQAATYCRFYDGYKREVQAQSIEMGLIEPDDPLYGWGWIAQHEPKVRVSGSTRFYNPNSLGKKYAAEVRDQNQAQTGELIVIKQNEIIATQAMYLLRATVSPIHVPEMSIAQFHGRKARLLKQIREPGLFEKVKALGCKQDRQGLLVGTSVTGGVKIGPI